MLDDRIWTRRRLAQLIVARWLNEARTGCQRALWHLARALERARRV